jgi:hypothetical protein
MMATTTADVGAEIITKSKQYYNETWPEIFIINLIINYLQNNNPKPRNTGWIPQEIHRKSTETGSSILVNDSGVRIYPSPPGIDKNLLKPAAG